MTDAAQPIRFHTASPILRIFDEALARKFYLGFLGFRLDWEHRFGEGFPLYAQVSRAGLTLHLSSHHGDASPGATVSVTTEGLAAWQQELADRKNPNCRPHIEQQPWGAEMTVTDPFGNRIRFNESVPTD